MHLRLQPLLPLASPRAMHSQALFRSLPGSGDGTVDYMDLLEKAQQKKAAAMPQMRTFLMAMAWDSTKECVWR